MKKILLFFIVLLNCSFAQNGWIKQTSGTANTLWSVSFVDISTGWIVGSIPGNGTILKTTNGGINWDMQHTYITNDFFACHFINENTGWVCGSRGIIIKTKNGGINWTMQLSITREDLWTIFFINNETGWAGGTGGKILKTTNSGDNWEQYNTKSNLISILYFIDSKTGWAAADNYPKSGIILKTENGGISWNVQLAKTLPVIESVHFINAYTGWVVGNDGIILKTTNGGLKWNTQESETEHILTDVYFVNELTGWICGGTNTNGISKGILLKTTNAGIKWIKQLDGVNFNSIEFVSNNTGYVVGDAGIIYKISETELNIPDGKSERERLISLYEKTIEYFKSPEYNALFKEPDMNKRNETLEEKQKQLFKDAGFEKPEDVQTIDEKFKDDPDITKLREEFDKVTQEVTEEMMKEQIIQNPNVAPQEKHQDIPPTDKMPTDKDNEVTDIDGNIYPTIKIGNQEWTTKNLNVSTFRNGESIKEARSFNEWNKARINKIPAWCYYNFDTKYKKYGKLYNIHAINDPRGLAPEGWHLPTIDEWLLLIKNLGGEKTAGKKMLKKSVFNGIALGGLFGGYEEESDDHFGGKGTICSWWFLTEGEITIFIDDMLIYYDSGVCIDHSSDGMACRCVRD